MEIEVDYAAFVATFSGSDAFVTFHLAGDDLILFREMTSRLNDYAENGQHFKKCMSIILSHCYRTLGLKQSDDACSHEDPADDCTVCFGTGFRCVIDDEAWAG